MNFLSIRNALRLPLMLLTLLCGFAASTAVSAGNFCFGAAGMQCGSFAAGKLAGVAFCAPAGQTDRANCLVSGGSLNHDPCCFDSPNGVLCGGNGSSNACQAAWDRSVHRAVWGYQWVRKVDTKKDNTSGDVVTADYCGRSNAPVHLHDTEYCCAGNARRASFWDRLVRPNLYRCN